MTLKLKLIYSTDEEEAAIQRGTVFDPDMPEWTEADFARVRPARQVASP